MSNFNSPAHYAKTYQLFKCPHAPVEIRGILHRSGSSRAWDGWARNSVSGYFDNEEDFIKSAEILDATGLCEGIYVTLNPVKPDLLARANNRLVASKSTTSDDEIVCRHSLLIDFDPKRPKGISSTDDELKLAADRARDCRDWLTSKGWPLPISAISGNGVHLIYRINLENTADNAAMLRHVLGAIALDFNDDTIEIDQKVFNAARITKLYGTVARKGDYIEDRPHRHSQIKTIPDVIEPVPGEKLTELAAIHQKHEADQKSHTHVITSSDDWMPQDFIREAIAKHPNERNNGGLWLACQLRDQGYSESDAEPVMIEYANSVDPNGYSESNALSSLRQAFKRAPREARSAKSSTNGYYQHNDAESPTANDLSSLRKQPEVTDKHRDLVQFLVNQNNLGALRLVLAEMPASIIEFVKECADAAEIFSSEKAWKKFASTCKFISDPLSAQIKADISKWDYELSMSDLDDSIFINNKRISDPAEAQLKVDARDCGYGDKGGKSLGALNDVMLASAQENRFHPIKRYLESLEWDGQDHFGQLVKYIKDVHEPIGKQSVFEAFLYRWMAGAIAKLYTSGPARVQNFVLVLSGEQGAGKSSLIRWLASSARLNTNVDEDCEFFIEDSVQPDHDLHKRFLSTKWIWEIKELDSTTRRQDVSALKGFLTSNTTTYKIPYAKYQITKPVITSFMGSLNPEDGYLNDPTGDRRYATVQLKSIDFDYLHKVDVDQLWAQMFYLYNRNPSIWKFTEAEMEVKNKINAGETMELPYESDIARFFEIDLEKVDDQKWWMTSSEIMEHLNNNKVSAQPGRDNRNIARALRKCGLDPSESKYLPNGKKARVYSGIRKVDSEGSPTMDEIVASGIE